MSQQKFNSQIDRNWSWPQKTWLQQRLALVRERQRALNRRSLIVPETAERPEDATTAEPEDLPADKHAL